MWIGRCEGPRRNGGEPRVLQSGGEFGEGDLGFEPGHGCSEAEVDAAAKAEVLVVGAVRDEKVWVRHVCGVAVACGQEQG
jgi:hypothetical protein